jgi:hypothetical protein
MRIVIETEATGTVLAELDSERCPKTVTAIREALPIEAVARRWGEEVYFEVPAVVEPEAPVELVAAGDLGYWPPGQAMCIFFGPTPASRSPGEIRPASPVNPIGRVLSDPKVFSKVRDGDRIVVRAA